MNRMRYLHSLVLAVVFVAGCSKATSDTSAPAPPSPSASSAGLPTPAAAPADSAAAPVAVNALARGGCVELGSDPGSCSRHCSGCQAANAPTAAHAAAAATPTAPALRPLPRRSPTLSQPAAAPSAVAPKTFACGNKGDPACPVQAWMKANMASAVASDDGPALAKQFDYVAAHAPPGFANWRSIAQGGAAKARAGDLPGAKTACKACHDQYKAKYKAELRDRPVLTAMAPRSPRLLAKVGAPLGRPRGRFTQHRRLDKLRVLLEHHPRGMTLYELADSVGVTPRSMRRYLKEVSSELELEPVPTRAGRAEEVACALG